MENRENFTDPPDFSLLKLPFWGMENTRYDLRHFHKFHSEFFLHSHAVEKKISLLSPSFLLSPSLGGFSIDPFIASPPVLRWVRRKGKTLKALSPLGCETFPYSQYPLILLLLYFIYLFYCLFVEYIFYSRKI